MKKDKYLIALAGLFHDIGKFYYRAKRLTTSDKEKKEFAHAHAVLSAKWIQEHKDIFEEIEQGLTNILVNWGARHHNPTDDLESKIVQIADRYSSAHEREKILQDELNFLHSVFERINFGKVDSSTEKTFGIYTPEKLKLDRELTFPKLIKGIIKEEKDNDLDKVIIRYFENQVEEVLGFVSSKDLTKFINDKYQKLFDDFNETFKKLSSNFTNSFERFFNFTYYLLQIYTWSVPASTYDMERKNRHYPDISLFDHSRVLSAIATSLYDYVKEKGINPRKNTTKDFDDKEVFLLVEGDVGGIQKFLFNIYKSSETSEAEFSIAKALRGRSFFLSMVPDIFARYILDELGYPITNAIYIGGGKLQLLIGNTLYNLQRLKEIEKEINEYLFKEFELDLSFSLATQSFKGIELKTSNGFLNQIEYLQQELDKKKKQKIGELLFEELETLEEAQNTNLCPSCKSLKCEGNSKLCKWCNLSQGIGNIIPKIDYLAFIRSGINLENEKKIIDFGKFGKVVLLDKNDVKKINENIEEILILNKTELTEYSNGFKFLGNTVPIITKENVKVFNEYKSEDISIEKNNVLPFEILVKFAQGDKKLGFFRADVDNLGLIFSDGLRSIEIETEEDESLYTISRIASLSRMLDLFFSGYLNKLAEEITKDYIKDLIKTLEKAKIKNEPIPLDNELTNIIDKIRKNNLENNFINSLIYIVYSGGDDLFIIAPYNLALKFAQKIREEFVYYTAKNPEFGLSGGLLFARHTLPINLVSKYAENLEDKAKEGTKDKIAIFQKSYKWEDFGIGESELVKCEEKEKPIYFSELERIIQNLEDLYNDKDQIISRGFLYNLLNLYNSYVKDKTKSSDKEIRIDPVIYPKLHYQIARNIKKKEDENVRNKLIYPLLNTENKWIIENLDTVVSLVLMKTRKGG
ncbi:MAG TPA: type III-A CRISPR-associated protein Cas10/Csm1 [Persephonella sp.]|nr:type III-A CRISPR-associated protein Cas10/Csm1 [Persephonella sp.]